MSLSMLPDAIQRERENMLVSGVAALRSMGNAEFAVHDLAGFPEPDALTIPVLNIHLQPDIQAAKADHSDVTLALVEVSSDLGDEACGRRWQALAAWAQQHDVRMVVFVHPEDQARAEEIAQIWHLPTTHLMRLSRPH